MCQIIYVTIINKVGCFLCGRSFIFHTIILLIISMKLCFHLIFEIVLIIKMYLILSIFKNLLYIYIYPFILKYIRYTLKIL